MRRLRLPWCAWWSAAFAAGMVLLATVKGPGLSADSVVYLSTGVNLAESGELTTLDGEPFTLYPPGLPLLAAAGEELGLGAQPAVRLFTAACAGAIVLLGYLLLRRVPVRAPVLMGATILLGISSAVLNVAKMAWTEAPFIVVTLVFLLVLGSVWRSGSVTGVQVASLAVLCWAAFFLRYAGLSLVVAGVATLALALRPRDRRRLSMLATFAALAVAAPAAWMLRNHAADGTWLGPREASTDTVGEVVRNVAGATGRWLLPAGTVDHPLLVAVGAVALAAVVFVGWRTLRSAPPAEPRRRELLAGVGPAVVFGVVYVAYLGVAQLTSAIDPIDARLLSPAFVPFVVVAAVALDATLDRLEVSPVPAWAGVAVPLVAGLFLVGQFGASARLVRSGAMSGIGYNAESWQRSELAEATGVLAQREDVEVLTNEQFGLWAASGLQRIRLGPKETSIRDVEAEGELDDFAAVVACDGEPVVLAMFTLARFDDPDVRVFPTDEIDDVVDLSVRSSFHDGVLFDVSPRPGTFRECRG